MTAPYYQDDLVTVLHGDCIEVMRSMPDNSVHAVVTDPPYALGFMGREWDTFGDVGRGAQARVQRADEVTATGEGHSTSAGPYLAAGVDSLRSAGLPFQRWCEEWSRECLRVLKPGGYILAFGGSRTWHRLAAAVEDAGFEIRDSIAWLYGSGFPKSMDVSKAIDKAAGHWRGKAGVLASDNGSMSGGNYERTEKGDPVTAAAAAEGWGTALKPAFEPIVVGRKPFQGTVAHNFMEHGTGALNIDASRVGTHGGTRAVDGAIPNRKNTVYGDGMGGLESEEVGGRWPTNVALDESQADALDEQSGILTSGLMKARTNREPRKGGTIYGADNRNITAGDTYADSGGASRFFPTFHYEAKAPGSERPNVDGLEHPTVKPLDLMRWLVRLVTPLGGGRARTVRGIGDHPRSGSDRGI